MAKAKTTDLTAMRDALPFFKNGNWWNVTPSGNYTDDLETGKSYARAFLPMMTYNAGPTTLGWIVDAMAKSGGDSKWRAIDAVSIGFLMEIGSNLQAAIFALSVARIAMDKDKPNDQLASKFVSRFDDGKILDRRAA